MEAVDIGFMEYASTDNQLTSVGIDGGTSYSNL